MTSTGVDVISSALFHLGRRGWVPALFNSRSLLISHVFWADNRRGQGKHLSADCRSILDSYAGIPINQLKAKYPGLILFPPSPATGSSEEFQKQCLFRKDEEGFETTNVMGIVALPGKSVDPEPTLAIGCRFDLQQDGCDLNPDQPFLTYLLAQSLDLQFSDWNIRISKKHMWDFLTALLWAFYLKLAFRKGLLKVYVNRRANDSKFQGALDVANFIKADMPFQGNVAYKYREHSLDNPVLHVIRAAGERVRVRLGSLWQYVIGDPEVRRAFLAIQENTLSYQGRDLRRLIAQARPVRHPYYSEYEDLRKLSARLLLGEGAALYGDQCSDGQVYGILFDGSWLWERFLARALEPLVACNR